jgi:IS605 OrfB family transposase
MLRRSIAVELEVTRELNKLLHSVETAYLNIVREVVEYAVKNNVLNATQLHKLFYHKYRDEYPGLHTHLVVQAIRQASEIAKSFVKRRRKGLVSKPYPEVKAVSIRFDETAWNYEQFIKSIAPVRVELSLLGGRREVWLRLHRRFWLFWWRVLTGEAELASTLLIKRRANKWYAVFVFEIKPRVEEPKAIVSYDINENTISICKIDITTVSKVTDWNRQYIMPQLYMIRTDFGRLARRYGKIRNTIIERLKQSFTLPSGKYVNITNTREYKKFVRRLREDNRKLGRVRQIANELTKVPTLIITEELGKAPQQSMINEIKRSETRHRVSQIPFKSIEKTVEDKALERGSKLVRVSSYRNSKTCPVHFVRLKSTNDWHVLYCPKGHYMHRDYTSILNMLWKVTPEGWVKGVWWDLRREMNWREYEDKHNPVIPQNIVQYIHAVLKSFVASEQCPAVLARGSPMNPAGGADEGWARAKGQIEFNASIIINEDLSEISTPEDLMRVILIAHSQMGYYYG